MNRDGNASEKPFDPERKSRLAKLKELCRGAKVDEDVVTAARRIEMERELQKKSETI
jgi:hypothetical protein